MSDAPRSPSEPPVPEGAGRSLPGAPPCPFCRGDATELMNPFGSHASVSTYWCRSCRSPFEILKWASRGGRKGEG